MIKSKTNDYSECYKIRFSNEERKRKNILWRDLCNLFLQRFVDSNNILMDVGAGYCEFVNNIKCAKKIAVDTNPDTKIFANKNIIVINKSIFDLGKQYNNSIDVIFVSNFLEHLNSKDDLLDVLTRINRLLKQNGKIILLQPNIDLIKEAYWDFVDHKIALNTKSMIEALTISGFKVSLFIKKFLPYTTKNSALPISTLLLKIYLLIPHFFRPFAGQSLVIGYKKSNV